MSDNPNALAKPQEKAITPLEKFKLFIRSDSIMQRFEEILGDRDARPFVNSVVLAVANNPKLLECTQASIITAAIRAAMLRLSVNDPTGQAWIVPYGGLAQFQVGYKGLRDMATEGGKVRHLHVAEIFEGEYLEEDRFTGLYELKGQKMSDKVHTLLCFYQDIYGFKKMIAHPIEKIHAHAKQYNPGGYNAKGSPWQSDKPRTVRQMEKKTILREMINAWVPLDPYKKKLMNAYDETAGEDLNVLEAQFSPDPREEVSEADLMGDLGYDDAPPPPAPVRTSTKPADPNPYIEQETPAMTLDTAKNVVNDKGVRYMDMPDDELVKAVQHLQQSIRTTTDTDRRVEQQFRLSAVNAIQLARKPTA